MCHRKKKGRDKREEEERKKERKKCKYPAVSRAERADV
jgi:hypothetical protein